MSYIIDIHDIIALLQDEGIEYLIIERKNNSLYGDDIDYGNIYILGYKREDYNKNNYEYEFFLFNLDLKIDKYSFINILNEKKEKFLTANKNIIIKALKQKRIANLDENDIMLIREEIKKETNFVDIYIHLLKNNLEPINISEENDGFTKKEIILKKKTTDKIIKTYGNIIFHSILYNTDELKLNL